MKFTFFKETKQVITKRLIFQSIEAPKSAPKVQSDDDKNPSLSKMAELDLKSTEARANLMKEMQEASISPILKEVSKVLREQSNQTSVDNNGNPKYKEGQKVLLPIPGYTVYSVRENGEIKIYEDDPSNPTQAKQIPFIAEWLKEKGIEKPIERGIL